MGKSSQQTTTQSQQSTTQPWDKAQPLLENLLKDYSALNPAVTGAQSNAANNISNEASGVQGFDTNTPISNLLNSSTTPQVGMLSSSLNSLNNSLAPVVDPNNLDPYKTPGFSDALNTLSNDITNNVKSVYAGSGRDPSGAGSFAGSLARGLEQGEAPVVANQFNANRSALMSGAGELNSATVGTEGAITGQQQVPLANEAQAIGLIPAAGAAATTPGQLQLGAANTSYNLPYTDLAALLQPSVALGGMGSQSQGSGTSVTSMPQSTFGNVLGGLLGGTGLLSNMGAFGTGGWLLASDEKVKDDVEKIGDLHDGQKVVRFRYKGDPTMRIGLLAQEVSEHEPDAVHQLPIGILAVDHKLATDKAARMGRAA
jgi:hypothetical protein